MVKLSNDDTLYDLCEQTAVAIETHPRNYNQADWLRPAKQLFGREACGTAYCRAGWMVALAEPVGTENTNTSIPNKAYMMFKAAGIPMESLHILFSDATVYGCGGDIGSEAYVKAGADGIRSFMTTYADKLKSVKLSDVRLPSGKLPLLPSPDDDD